ncbi:MAG: nitroreductase/quinone reductase family protein [Anaerolineae bacterium]
MSNEPQYLYLTTSGWKSGKAHEIEIWFVSLNGKYYLVSEMRQRAHWIQNIQHNPRISFRIGEQTYPGTGREVEPETEPELAAQVRALMDRKYKWSDGMIMELSPASQQ